MKAMKDDETSLTFPDADLDEEDTFKVRQKKPTWGCGCCCGNLTSLETIYGWLDLRVDLS